MSDDEIYTVDDIVEMAKEAPVMAPATVIAASVRTGVNQFLVTDEDVTTVEVLLIAPTDDGDQLAILPLIMTPELAEDLGWKDTTDESE